MTFDIGLHEVCVRVGVRYVITKFYRMDSLPNFVTHGAPLSIIFFQCIYFRDVSLKNYLILYVKQKKINVRVLNSVEV